MANAYTYVPADELDFNGTWNGFGHDGQDIPLGFVIRNLALVSASCDEYTTLTFSPPVPVSGGAFSCFGADGRGIEGRIVSANDAVGTSNIPPCNRGSIWGAAKQAPSK